MTWRVDDIMSSSSHHNKYAMWSHILHLVFVLLHCSQVIRLKPIDNDPRVFVLCCLVLNCLQIISIMCTGVKIFVSGSGNERNNFRTEFHKKPVITFFSSLQRFSHHYYDLWCSVMKLRTANYHSISFFYFQHSAEFGKFLGDWSNRCCIGSK